MYRLASKWLRTALTSQIEFKRFKIMELQYNADWQTKARGSNDSEYQLYLELADNGEGLDITTGKPLKTYDEWINS